MNVPMLSSDESLLHMLRADCSLFILITTHPFHPHSSPNPLPQPRLLHLLHIDVHSLPNHNILYCFPINLPILAPVALPAYAFQQHAGRLIARVLRHEPAGKRLFQNALAQPLGTPGLGELSLDGSFEDGGTVAFELFLCLSQCCYSCIETRELLFDGGLV